jgi:hypothetical protein
MIEDQVAEFVKAHYAREGAEILLLSKLGEQLIKDGAWPLDRSDKRTLFQVAEATPGISIVTDPSVKAFIALVEAGNEQHARDEIERRKKLFFLRGLPRAVLLAFTLEMAPGSAMYLALTPRPEYRGGLPVDDPNFQLVEEDLRLPGLDVTDLENMSEDNRGRLETNIREWANRHGVDWSTLKQRRTPTQQTVSAPTRALSALDRLLAAQAPDVAKRLNIPIDIAVALSRLP